MFPYSDPVGTDILARTGALDIYRAELHSVYLSWARLPDSAFTLLSAFQSLSDGEQPAIDTIDWQAFPKSAGVGDAAIEANRFLHQDEYIEWYVERSGGVVSRIIFTSEFPEHFEAMAQVGFAALAEGIRDVIPNANPTAEELFGPNFNPDTAGPEERAQRFRARTTASRFNPSVTNPWNTGQKGILCLGQPANTLGALFQLVARCAIPNRLIDSSDVCGQVGGACGPNRNSDPVVCTAAQNAARVPRGLSLLDPPGIKILRLEGIWKINGRQIDINEPAQNEGAWIISRNGRRAVLDVSKGVTMGDTPITSGVQVSRQLFVGAEVISALENALPEWARTGHESRVVG